ncbi:MAG: potassium-transporting ATPase subunit KdpC [Polyangiaceae bacterium]|nr:potassium-transporting ATPase subunit KdpC [Polyangiaceae bacterium]
MTDSLRPAVVLLAAMTLLTGVAYPALVGALAGAIFPQQAQGSLVIQGGRVAGSSLVGQPFSAPKYFWGRLSATGPHPYNAGSSSGSNLGPSNPDLVKNAKARLDALREADPTNQAPVPVDLVTASGSGLDPHISPAAAEYQVQRVAHARGLGEGAVRELVQAHTTGRQFGVFGEPVVNVVALNLALDARGR